MRYIHFLIIAIFFITSPAFSAELFHLNHSTLTVVVSDTSQGYEIVISGAKPSKVNSFTLTEPTRVVIDLIDTKIRGSLSKELSVGKFSAIRFGVHPDKTRIVFDLNTDSVPHVVAEAKQNISIALNFKASNIKPLDTSAPHIEDKEPINTPEVEVPITAPTEPAPVENIPSPKDKDGTEMVPLFEDIDDHGKTEDIIPPPIEEPQKSASQTLESPPIEIPSGADTQTSVNEILFRNGTLIINVHKVGSYELLPAKPSLFELKINSATLTNDGLKYPQFPPAGYKGFQAVVAKPVDEGVLIKIFVDEGTRLRPAKNADGDIEISVEQ